jgi:hypothetical protein
MNKALFLSVQLDVDEMTSSPALVELLNGHLVFAVDVAEAADALVQLASVRQLSSGVEASVEIPAVALEQLRQALETLSEYDQSWLFALRPLRGRAFDVGAASDRARVDGGLRLNRAARVTWLHARRAMRRGIPGQASSFAGVMRGVSVCMTASAIR